MRCILILYAIFISQLAYSQVVTNKRSPVSTYDHPVQTWKPDSVSAKQDQQNIKTIVPANYQAKIPAPLTTEGLFTIFSPFLYQNDKRVLPAPPGTDK